eukprot:Gb_05642 [translate_table: standard]
MFSERVFNDLKLPTTSTNLISENLALLPWPSPQHRYNSFRSPLSNTRADSSAGENSCSGILSILKFLVFNKEISRSLGQFNVKSSPAISKSAVKDSRLAAEIVGLQSPWQQSKQSSLRRGECDKSCSKDLSVNCTSKSSQKVRELNPLKWAGNAVRM